MSNFWESGEEDVEEWLRYFTLAPYLKVILITLLEGQEISTNLKELGSCMSIYSTERVIK
jgi:hypothetical protein